MTDQLPENVVLDLDSVEREEKFDPFTVRIAGRTITMTDPAEIDWQDLLALETPVDFLRFCMSADDRDFLAEQRIPGWKLGRLMEAYQRHYKLEEQIAAARRRSSLS